LKNKNVKHKIFLVLLALHSIMIISCNESQEEEIQENIENNNGNQEGDECQTDDDCIPLPIQSSNNKIRCITVNNSSKVCSECVQGSDCPSGLCIDSSICAISFCESDEHCRDIETNPNMVLYNSSNELNCIQVRPDALMVCSECTQDSDCPSGVCRGGQICAPE
jgi:Cys-rich repeat protein